MTQSTDWNAVLAQGSKTKANRPPLVMLYAEKKFGKTTFAAEFPEPAFLCGEDGAHSIANHRWPSDGVIENWEQLLNYTRAFAYGKHDFKTLVTDTVGPLASLALAYTVEQSGKGSWEKMGWGKEEDLVLKWRLWLALLEHCRTKRGMTVLLLGHVAQRGINNLQLGEKVYTYQGELHQQLWSITSNWVDILLYGARDSVFEDATTDNGKPRAKLKEDRWLYTVSESGFEAGVRGGYWLPPKIPLSYAAFNKELSDTPEKTRERITALAKTIPATEDLAVKNLLLWTVPANLATLGMGKLRALEVQLKAAKEPKEPAAAK